MPTKLLKKQLFKISLDGSIHTWTVGDEIMHSLWWVVKVMILGTLIVFILFSWSEVLVVRWVQGYSQLSFSCQQEISGRMNEMKYVDTASSN